MNYRLMLLFIWALLLVGCGESQASSSPTLTPPSITQPTLAPTQTSTNASTSIQPTSGPAILGGDLGAFVAKYGQPNEHSTPSGGLYHFQRYSGSNIDFLIIQTDVADGGVYAQHVEGVTAQASDTGADTGWTQQEASAMCATFFPTDARYQRKVTVSGGYDTIYFSPSLATLFPASAFTDANQNTVTAGLFDVQYLYKSGTNIDSCAILIGTEQT